MLLKLLLLLVVLAPVPAPARPDPLGFGYLGVQAAVDAGTGVVLSRVVDDTPAARAGLRVGDTIVQVGRHSPRLFDDLREYVSGLRPGTRLAVVVRRGDRTLTLPLTVGAAPPTVQVFDPLDPTGQRRVMPIPPPNR